MSDTIPGKLEAIQGAPYLNLPAAWIDPTTGALYVHQDMRCDRADWTTEEHIAPTRVSQAFGDIESFAAYVKRYGPPSSTVITWNAAGFSAVLDYASAADQPGRHQWIAKCPFVASPQWRAWQAFANGQALAQRAAVERLEDLADDIREPSAGDLMLLLRSLRASVNAQAETELRPDGSTSVAFRKDTSVKAGAVDLPPMITITVPILKGHTVVYSIGVRVRVSVDDGAHLTLRFSIPNAERAQEDAYADQVAAAATLLPGDYQLLRAAD